METKVLTQDEITQLKAVQQERYSLIDKFGTIEIQFQELESTKQKLKLDYEKLKQKEDVLGKQLQSKYGDGTINLEKGEFVSA
jgi:predicted  nucleic acid-binding Zn-ribbon protein